MRRLRSPLSSSAHFVSPAPIPPAPVDLWCVAGHIGVLVLPETLLSAPGCEIKTTNPQLTQVYHHSQSGKGSYVQQDTEYSTDFS
ncbi:uncharacterized [Tachysurus ichikawai]